MSDVWTPGPVNRGRRAVSRDTRYRQLKVVSRELVRQIPGTTFWEDSKTECGCIVSQEALDVGLRWHLSISHPDRYPEWDEIADARYALVPDEAYMVMILPPRRDYVNVHPNCFHLHEVPEARSAAER